VAFADSFIVRLENEDTEVKYQIPRLEIATLIDDNMTLRSNQSEIDQKYKNFFNPEKPHMTLKPLKIIKNLKI
jgi:hypothetical protein